MRLLMKVSLALAAGVFAIAVAPTAKADPLTVSSGGFTLTNLGNDGTGIAGLDSLVGAANSTTRNVGHMDSYVALLNPLTFTVGFTGLNSGGSHPFTFSQLLTINGQTQVLNLVGRIDIGSVVDTVHILSAAPLTFNFSTFSVAVNVIPTSITGTEGVFCGELKARIDVDDCNPVPEPATLTLLGIGLAGAAAKLRQRRKSKTAN